MRAHARPWLWLLLGAAALFAIAAAACRGDDSPASARTTATAAPADATNAPATGGAATATPSPPPGIASRAACDAPRPRAAGDTAETLRSGGLDRAYLLHVPASYDGVRRTPLVLNLHGFGSNGRQQATYSRLPAKADAEGFIVVSPDGAGAPLRWTYPGLGSVDDVAFMRELLDRIQSDLCIDARRVFIAGMSNGAAFAGVVACAMPDRITSVAAVAAFVYPQRCGDAPVAIVGFQGTDDPCVPFTGGTSACGQKLPVPAVEEAAKNWARHDACDIAPAEQRFSPHVRTIAYSGCKDEAAVVLFVIEGGGHTWPGAIDVARLGATTREIDATDQIWQFFVAQGNLRR